MIEVAHNCAVLGVAFDSSRLLNEPPGDYLLALQMIVERVSQTNQREAARMEAQRR